MALLVNYEGSYLPPQKLWYMVDGVWKEVTNVYENAAQQELAVLDQERIKQDQVVAALATREAQLLARIDGSDPSVALEEDPAQIDLILQELETIALQVEISKTEQVVLTKKLFEQKAQMEYLKLVSEGEQALEKIVNIVDNPVNWKVIRIAPQSTLEERLEIAIQHGLDTNDRIFNYGLVYYRLFKVENTNPYSTNDDLEYLKEQFKRRLDGAAYLLGIEPTNYILTIDDVQNVYMEVNQFVSSGAKRIEDYLASIKDQQKYILDKIELAKESMAQLEQKVIDGKIETVGGMIITAVTKPELQVPVGKVLLEYQNVDSFDKLVSTTTLTNIANGTADVNNYPGIVKLNSDATSLNEKIAAVSEIVTINSEIQNTLVTGTSVFSLNVLSAKKATLTPSQLLFWNSPLGDSEIASSGGKLNYNQTFSSSGTYKFKNDELVKLSTIYTAIINALAAGTFEANNIVLGMTFKAGQSPKIISVRDGEIFAYDTNDNIKTKAVQTSIINAKVANTQDSNTLVSINTKEQPHHSIVFVKDNTPIETESSVLLEVYQPVINGLFYAETEDSGLNDSINVTIPIYEYSFNIHPILALNFVDPIGSFGFNAKEIPLTDYYINNDNIINQIIDSNESIISIPVLSFNTKEIPITDYFINNDNIINQIKEELVPNEIPFNAKFIEASSFITRNQNIIEQDKVSILTGIPVFDFNTKQTNSYLTVKNGYGQVTSYSSIGSLNGMTIIKPSNIEVSCIIETSSEFRYLDGTYKKLDFYQKTRIVITTQTGLAIFETDGLEGFTDTLNKLVDSLPRMITASSVTPFNAEDISMDMLNVFKVETPLLSTNTSTKTYTAKYNEDKLNYCGDGVPQTITLLDSIISTIDPLSDNLNKDNTSILVPAMQLNPGVLLA